MSVLGADAASGPAGPRTRARLGWSAAAPGVVVAFVALGVLSEAFAPAPSGPAGSALSTTPAGVAAWAQLLGRAGHPVGTLREPLATARLPPAATLVVLEAGSLTRPETAHLRAFVSAGGRLVIGGGDPSRTLGGLLGAPPGWIARGPLIAPRSVTAPRSPGSGRSARPARRVDERAGRGGRAARRRPRRALLQSGDRVR